MPTSGASADPCPGVTEMRSTSGAIVVGSSGSTTTPSRVSVSLQAASTPPARRLRAAEQSTRVKPWPVEPILVVHRRLVHHVGERLGITLGPRLRKKIKSLPRMMAIEV